MILACDEAMLHAQVKVYDQAVGILAHSYMVRNDAGKNVQTKNKTATQAQSTAEVSVCCHCLSK